MIQPSPNFQQPLIEAIRAVELASRHIVTASENNHKIDVTVKDDFTLVLNLDIELQKILLENLKSLPAVSEEIPSTHIKIGQKTDYFVIDPLDGTTSAKRFLTALDSQVGFGPMIGVVKNGILEGAVFFNCPQRMVFAAEIDKGCFCWKLNEKEKTIQQLLIKPAQSLRECAVLFYAGVKGELSCIEKIKKQDLVENVYRFGGFANDCSRIARGFEQIQIQFSVKAWDLSGSLLAHEAGAKVILDPLGERVDLTNWNVRTENPLVSAPAGLMGELLQKIC